MKTFGPCGIGTPLRSKRGKEVFGAVQALWNKVEAHGFPVHRYHADRAQELKSKALVAWLRDRGIHATWTPGDSPAGNKAELAVQRLKQSSRKLLTVAKIGPEFWPLAVLHASNRHWVELCFSLGIKQAHLLPFGLRIHARQRAKAGYLSHWRSRTVDARYLGQAPHTPGGHLALVGEARVLLTNTVYAVGPRAVKDAKPTYRIKGKTAPEFLMRVIQAVPGRPIPGPGCHLRGSVACSFVKMLVIGWIPEVTRTTMRMRCSRSKGLSTWESIRV